jgi:hypothetical protein
MRDVVSFGKRGFPVAVNSGMTATSPALPMISIVETCAAEALLLRSETVAGVPTLDTTALHVEAIVDRLAQ